MIKKLLLPFSCMLVLSSCSNNSDSTEKTDDNNTKVEAADTTVKAPKTKKETIEISEGFDLIIPDTVSLFKQYNEDEDDNSLSLAHAYLNKYYAPISEMDSIEYYGDSEEYICHFYQEFEYGISYSKDNCSEEGGAEQVIIFPKTANDRVKEFVNTLFYDSWNTWTSDYDYEADGAGCYYNIKHTDLETKIYVWCGC